VEHIRERFSSAPAGEVWAGDDAAVLRPPAGPLLLTVDTLVEGVHFDLRFDTAAQVGTKSLAVSVSDIAAMGGRPLHAVVSLGLPSARGDDERAGVLDGVESAAWRFACPVVGGDVTSAPVLTITVAVTGTVDGEPGPVLRSGARPGDTVLVTGPLGGAAAGLGVLRDGAAAGAGAGPGPVLAAHWDPTPRVAEGMAARRAGATAMLDLSDGLALDLRRLATASGVGVVVEEVPVADGATGEEALTGGDDYELVFAAPDLAAVAAAFATAGLRPPIVVGRCTDDPGERRLGDGPLPEGGWEHTW